MTDDTKKPEEATTDKGPAADKKKKEPTSETLQNFSRVTTAQLAHISFPPDSRFQPVRSFTPPTASVRHKLKGVGKPATERYAGGGGIIMLVDRCPGEETKFIDLPPELGGEQSTSMVVDQEPPDMMLDAQEAEVPEPFEVSYSISINTVAHIIFSILLTTERS
jgi:26S proteasome regulatory subunit N2